MSDSLHFLILDLETTGLDEHQDGIIEIAAIGTNRDLDPLFEFSAVIKPSQSARARLEANEFLMDMHASNGLLDAIASPIVALDLDNAVALLIACIETHRGPNSPAQIILGGSGVSHFDYRMLQAHAPQLVEHLFYSTFDVGVLRRAYLTFTGHDLVDANEHKTHRAMDDVECHLAEARAFRTMMLEHARANPVD